MLAGSQRGNNKDEPAKTTAAQIVPGLALSHHASGQPKRQLQLVDIQAYKAGITSADSEGANSQ